MTEAVFRDPGSFTPGPQVAPGQQAAEKGPEVLAPAPLGFTADVQSRPTPLDLVAEFIAHAGTQTPCTIGLLGRSGTGKSFALSTLLARVTNVTGAAAGVRQTPFLARISTMRIDAATLEGDAATALAAALHDQLATTAPDLTREAAHAVQDPQLVARDAAERHDTVQRRLENERRGLDELDGRRARLAELILYETPGSQVDSYARSNRARIEKVLAGFGIGGDPIRSYKDLVRALVDAGGTGGRTSLSVRAFWSFKGQFKLIVTAILLVVLGIALGIVIEDRANWLTWLRAQSDSMLPVANWMETHVPWLGVLQKVAFAGAALAILANVWRGIRFLQPVFRGFSLLQGDLDSRKRDLDTAFAHQTRRVDVLTSEVDAAAKHAADAERRAGTAGPLAAPREPPPFEATGGWTKARDYVAAVDRHIDNARKAGTSTHFPQRIVIALDDLESVSANRAREILDACSRLTADTRNCISIVALDPHAIGQTDEGRRALDKWIGVPFRVSEMPQPDAYGAMIRAALGEDTPQRSETRIDPEASLLDKPIPETEIDMLSAFGSVVGSAPRAIKRFVNLFRIARLTEGAEPASLALMLALDAGGTAEEIAAFRAANARTEGEGLIQLGSISPRLRQVEESVPSLRTGLSKDTAARAATIASIFSFRG